MKEVQEFKRVIACLRLELPEEIMDDVSGKFNKVVDAIEVLQQEINRQIYKHGIVAENRDLQEKRGDELVEEKRELQQEIQQYKKSIYANLIGYADQIFKLQAQNAKFRQMVVDKTNSLKAIFNKMNYTGHAWMPLDEIDDYLAETPPTDYHNPADVQEIERLNELTGCGCGLCLVHNNMICPKLIEKAGGEK